MNRLLELELRAKLKNKRYCDQLNDRELTFFISKMEKIFHFLVVHNYKIRTKYFEVQPNISRLQKWHKYKKRLQKKKQRDNSKPNQ